MSIINSWFDVLDDLQDKIEKAYNYDERRSYETRYLYQLKCLEHYFTHRPGDNRADRVPEYRQWYRERLDKNRVAHSEQKR